ncbi:MAG: four helix bundle protein [Candidatus Heimdallarchaeaceae archaeon]
MYNFQNLIVYKKAKTSNTEVYRLVRNNRNIDKYIESQLKRASISVVTNIAEGTGKSSYKDKRNFYRIARASAYECVSLLEILIDLEIATKERVSSILSQFEEISKMLYVLINTR